MKTLFRTTFLFTSVLIVSISNYSNAQNNVIGIFDPLNMSQEFQDALDVISPDTYEVFDNIDGNINNYDALFLFLGEDQTPLIYLIDSVESFHLINYLNQNGKIHFCSNIQYYYDNDVWEYIGINEFGYFLPVFDINNLYGVEGTFMDGIDEPYFFTTDGIPYFNGGETVLVGEGDFLDYYITFKFETDTFKVLYSFRNILNFYDVVRKVLNYFELAWTPVELTSFTAKVVDDKVQLNWSTASETNNRGFEVQRMNGKWKMENGKWEKVGFVEGNGTTTESQNYSFIDENITPGKYLYRLKQIDYDGSYEYSNEVEVDLGMPKEFSLKQNYPNPFNPATTIEFTIPETGLRSPLERGGRGVSIKLIVYDILGNEVATLVNEIKEPGNYEVEFFSDKLSSGVYFYELKVGNFQDVKKMILTK